MTSLYFYKDYFHPHLDSLPFLKVEYAGFASWKTMMDLGKPENNFFCELIASELSAHV